MSLETLVPYLELAGAMVVGILARDLVFWLLRDRKDPHSTKRHIMHALRSPTRLGAALLGAAVTMPSLFFPVSVRGLLGELGNLALIATVGWLLIAGISVAGDVVQGRYGGADADNLLARKIQTRIAVIGRVLSAFVAVITAAAMLMTLPGVRALGTSILASAGLIGIVAGLAAQPLLTNLLAGLQIAVTQPLRLDDIVVVSAPTSPSAPYWGTVEEITAAYVVIKVWDLRRLIVPLTTILNQPFENWTYQSSALLGYVMLYTDYRVDVEALRSELKSILDDTPLWDGKTWSLQVTTLGPALNPNTIGLRALFSVRNSDDRWNLMVLVQERLGRYLADRQPESLPHTRVTLETPQAPPHGSL